MKILHHNTVCRLVILFSGILSLLYASGCGEREIYKIGVSQCSQDDWRAKMNDEIEREIMLHEDAMVEIRSADDSNEKQIRDIEYFVDNGFDIIIVAPNEAAALTPVIDKVYASGLPVIVFDRNITSGSYTANIQADNRGLGRAAADYAAHLLGPDVKALEIYGRPGSTPAEDRHHGFAEEIERQGGTLVASASAGWKKKRSISVADSLLRLYPEVNLIYAHNDRMAIGASEVARRMGRGDIRIIGIDAAPDIGIKAVADSVIDATFLYHTEGHRVIRTALAILRGEEYARDTLLPVSSAVDLTNADILLRQNESLKEETSKMRLLKNRIDDYWDRHSSQTWLFYASIAIIILLFGVVSLILRAYWQHRRHQSLLLSQNKMLEEQRDRQHQLNEQLQDAIQSKLTFFTNVSHDLRTPLTLIAEPVAQLASAGNLTERQHRLIRIADKNVRILHRLINQILDFRKYENDKMHLSLTEINIGEAIEEWVESFHSLARKRHLSLELVAPDADHSPGSMALDAEKIERVFFNLISNAFKYTPDNGCVTVAYRLDGDRLVISVADNGQGISERDMGSIFNRFFQAERVHPNGSGIGLSLSKAFVELHGGTIEVESVLNEGSVFTVTLPVRHVDGEAARPTRLISGEEVEAELDEIAVAEEMSDEKPLVLVIDDNADIRRMISELLSDSYSVISAADGKVGLEKAVRYVPDLVICDVMMPVVDGMECCRRLKEEMTTSHIPVLMLTACTMDEQRVQGYESGADAYLSKPFSSAVLLARCGSLIANRRRIKAVWMKTEDNTADVAYKRDCGDSPDDRRHSPSDIDDDFYRRFLDIFRQEIGNSSVNVDALASRMGLERTQFYRKIKALTGYAPVELIRRLRLEHARNLIMTTGKTISEVAYEAGFSTPAYFTRCYREAFGQTPSDTRAKR